MSAPTPLRVAREYIERGWSPIPVPDRKKAPTLRGWPTLRISADDAPAYFNEARLNVGVLLGEPSGGLRDVDLDCAEALSLAPRFLPPTDSRFGRESKRASHRLYVVTPPVNTEKFADPDPPPHDKGTLVELRWTGAQTIFPGSVHESGEPVTWDQDGEPARADGPTLRRTVTDLAAACVLARHWPREGHRHDAALAAAGLLVRGGLDEARAGAIVYHAALAAGDMEAGARRRDVVSTMAAIAAGRPVTGGPTLAEILRGDGSAVVGVLRKWLALGVVPPHLTDMGNAERFVTPHLTDTGNAERFVAQHGGDARYCYVFKTWLLWDGMRWRSDAGDAVMRRAKETARGIYAEAARERADDERKALVTWARKSESVDRLRAMIELAKAELPITPAQLDRDPYLLNTPTGTLELRTLTLRAHRREDFLTKMTSAPYDPAARHPVWEAYLERVLPEPKLRAHVRRVAGYCLTGSTAEEKFFIAYGPTSSGKTTLLGALRHAWGDYAKTADSSTFAVQKANGGPREDIARLHGARLVVSSEVQDGTRLAEALVKTLTGGDRVAARRLYKATFEFVPQFKLVIAANHRPHVRDDDAAIWRRIVELPFRESIPKDERDPAIKATLMDPAAAGAAILAWAAQGTAEWLAGGLGSTPDVEEATRAYREAMDPLKDFIEEKCRLDPAEAVTAGALRTVYERWAKDQGVRCLLTPRELADRLRAKGCTNVKGARGVRFWRGIGLLPEEDDGGADGASGASFHKSPNT